LKNLKPKSLNNLRRAVSNPDNPANIRAENTKKIGKVIVRMGKNKRIYPKRKANRRQSWSKLRKM
jgi:hypothetical protein